MPSKAPATKTSSASEPRSGAGSDRVGFVSRGPIEIEGGVPGQAGCARLLFVPPLLLGLLAMAGGLFGALQGRGGVSVLVALGGAAMAIPALLAITVRAGTRLDPARRVIERAVRVLGITVPRRAIPFDRVVEVGVERQQLRHAVFFPVVIRGETEVEIGRRVDAQEARQLGERIARIVGRPLRDRSLEGEVLREPEELDVPLRARLERVPPPEGPPPARLVPSGPNAWELPAKGLALSQQLALLGVAVLVAVPLVSAILAASASDWGSAIGGVAGTVVSTALLAWLLLPGLRIAWARERLSVDANGIRVESRTPFGASHAELAADEIEEVVLVRAADRRGLGASIRGTELVVRGDRASVSFGRGLSEDELRWLRQHILAALSG